MNDNTDALPPLLPCPFCGKDAAEVRQVGSPLQFCLVVCGWCGLRHESSDIGNASGTSWNTRAALAQRQQVPGDVGPAGEFGKQFGCSGPIDLTAAPSAQAETQEPLTEAGQRRHDAGRPLG